MPKDCVQKTRYTLKYARASTLHRACDEPLSTIYGGRLANDKVPNTVWHKRGHKGTEQVTHQAHRICKGHIFLVKYFVPHHSLDGHRTSL